MKNKISTAGSSQNSSLYLMYCIMRTIVTYVKTDLIRNISILISLVSCLPVYDLTIHRNILKISFMKLNVLLLSAFHAYEINNRNIISIKEFLDSDRFIHKIVLFLQYFSFINIFTFWGIFA